MEIQRRLFTCLRWHVPTGKTSSGRSMLRSPSGSASSATQRPQCPIAAWHAAPLLVSTMWMQSGIATLFSCLGGHGFFVLLLLFWWALSIDLYIVLQHWNINWIALSIGSDSWKIKGKRDIAPFRRLVVKAKKPQLLN